MKLNLVKYCKSRHAIDATKKGKIFVGTFSKYHKIENDALKDKEEGAATPAILDAENDLLISENDNNLLLNQSSIKLKNGWKINVPKGLPLWLDKPSFNTFVYCVSNDPDPSLEKAERLGYDDYFLIEDPAGFCKALMKAISLHFKSPFGVRGEMGPVIYTYQKIQALNRATPIIPNKSFNLLDLFTKHEKFRPDKEFRFIVLEYSNVKQTEYSSVKTDGEIIENHEISQWIKKS